MKHFLVIGLGSIGRRHAANLFALYPDARFTFLRHQNQRDTFCDQLDATIATDLDALLAQDFDLAIVASPSANHIDTLPRLIARGWPLLVEKPIVSTLGDCDIVEGLLAKAPEAVRAAAFNFRYIPSLMTVRKMLRDGQLGHVVRASLVAGQWLPAWRPAQDYRLSYSADARRGGGVELDLVHEIDLVRWFFGETQLEYARCGKYSDLEIAANDTALMVFSAGPAGPVIHVSLDYVSRQRLRHYEVVGDRAGLCWDIRGTLDLISPEGRKTIDGRENGFDVAQSYVDMLRAVFAAIDGNGPDPTQSLDDGLKSTRLALQVREEGRST